MGVLDVHPFESKLYYSFRDKSVESDARETPIHETPWVYIHVIL